MTSKIIPVDAAGRPMKKANGMKWVCQNPKCEHVGKADWGEWSCKFTGSFQAMCPECGEISTFIGVFGQKILLERLKDDLKSMVTTGLCEYASVGTRIPEGHCEHEDREQPIECQQQNCPWPERRGDFAWWDGREGAYAPRGSAETPE